jgi:hypothetical protein
VCSNCHEPLMARDLTPMLPEPLEEGRADPNG